MDEPLTLSCSATSRQAGEQLFGTVKSAAVWLLLEHAARWGPEAFEDSDLPEPVRARLQTALDTIPQSRLLLIRQKPRLAPPGFAFFVVLSRETDPVLYEFHLATYDDLLALELPAICAEDPAYDAQRRTDPLLLVCTHGRRDACCARYGVAVADRLAADLGAAVWQSSHVGGHRFAANAIWFPQGVFYGTLDGDRVPAVLAAGRAGEIALDHYRGRAAYPKVAQAADYFLRAETGVLALDAYRLVGVERAGDDRWTVRFVAQATGDIYAVSLVEDRSSVKTIASCGDTDPSPVTQVRRVGIEVIPGANKVSGET